VARMMREDTRPAACAGAGSELAGEGALGGGWSFTAVIIKVLAVRLSSSITPTGTVVKGTACKAKRNHDVTCLTVPSKLMSMGTHASWRVPNKTN